MRLQVVLVALAFGALLLYCGFGLIRLLAPERLRGGELVLAPAAGFALLVTVGSWSGWLGQPAGVALAVALGMGTLLNVLALRLGRPSTPAATVSLGGTVLALLVLALGVAPLWTSHRPTVVIGQNGDQVFYTSVASYLSTAGLPVPAPGPIDPAATLVAFLNHGVPLGFSYAHAMVDQLTGLPPYETFSTITAVLLALNPLSLAFLAERLFGLGRRWALGASALAALSPTLAWVHYNNYAPHMATASLLPAAFAVAILALEGGAFRGLMLAALLLSALLVTYPLGAGPFLLAPLGVYAALRAWRGAPAAVLRRCVVLALLVGAANLAGLAHVTKVLPPMLERIAVKEFGDVLAHVSWAQVLGLVHHTLPSLPGSVSLGMAVLAAAALLAGYGAAASTPEGRRAFLSLLVTAVPFLLWLRFGLDYPYGFYKGLTFLVSPLLVGFTLGVNRAMRAAPVVRASALVLLGVVAATSGANLLRMSRGAPVFDIAPMLELRELSRLVPRNQAVHVRDESGTALLWVTYFLRDRPVYLANYSPYYVVPWWAFYQEQITAPVVLVNRDAMRANPWEAGTLYENQRYRAVRKNPAILAHLAFSREMRLLEPGEPVHVALSPDRLLVDGRAVNIGPVGAEGQAIALELFAAGGSTLRLLSAEGERSLRVNSDREVVSWPVPPGEFEATIVNAGSRPVLVGGWIDIARENYRFSGASAPEAALSILQDEVLPGSGFFAVNGWHGPESGSRWSRAAAVAVFRVPSRSSSLRIEGHLPPPARAAVLVDGRRLGDVTGAGEFSMALALPKPILDGSSWGILEIRVDRVFVPKELGPSTDERTLGVAIRTLRLEALE